MCHVLLQCDAEVVGSQRGDDERTAVLVVDVAQDGFINRTRQREAEIGVLAVAHVGEVLVGHRLQDGTGYLRQTRLRIVAVEEFPAVPVAVFVFQVQRLVRQQRIGEVA